MNLSFHPGTHTYQADERILPSVTGILRAVGLTSQFEFRDRIHAFRGTVVHEGAALILEGKRPTLDPLPPSHAKLPDYIKVHGEIEGYWDAMRAAQEAIKFAGCISEARFIDPVRGYAGTFDFGAYSNNGKEQLWDIKSGLMPDMTVVQVCAYEDLARRGLPIEPEHPGMPWLLELVKSGRPLERCALRLEKTGRFTAYYECKKGRSFNDPMFMSAWRSALALYTLVPGHLYTETTPDGVVVGRSHLSDLHWVAERVRSLPSPTYDSAMRAGENLWNLRSQYGLL